MSVFNNDAASQKKTGVSNLTPLTPVIPNHKNQHQYDKEEAEEFEQIRLRAIEVQESITNTILKNNVKLTQTNMSFTSETAREAGKKSTRAGKKNKTTEEIRERFQMLVSDNLEKLRDDLASLPPEKRIKYIIELSKFVVPTLKAAEITTSETAREPILFRIIDKESNNQN